jgi:hypothetical protein
VGSSSQRKGVVSARRTSGGGQEPDLLDVRLAVADANRLAEQIHDLRRVARGEAVELAHRREAVIRRNVAHRKIILIGALLANIDAASGSLVPSRKRITAVSACGPPSDTLSARCHFVASVSSRVIAMLRTSPPARL